MKKIFVAALGCIALLGAASCDNSAKSSKEYTPEQTAFGDSVAAALGHVSAANELAQLNRMWDNLTEEQRANFSKDQFVKGLELVLNTDTTDLAYLNGIYAGLNLYNPMIGSAEQADCPVEPAKVIAAFKEIYLKDTISQATLMTYTQEYHDINSKVRSRADVKKAAEKAQQIEANGKAGKDYIATLADKGYETTESGLVYKIENAGDANKITPSDQISIRYVGRHVNGEIFDQTTDKPFDCQPSNFIPGFAEGLQLIGKGGKITLVIPGNLGYGDMGAAPRIAPNETLIFEISVEK